MASSASAIKMLFDLASEEVDAAAKQLAQANHALQEALQQKAMLQEYNQNYVDHLNGQLTQGLGKQEHLNYQHFLQNLAQAINGQDEMVTHAEYERDNAQKILQAAQRKKMSYEVLIDRAKKQALRQENKKEQKAMDEFAMRAKR